MVRRGSPDYRAPVGDKDAGRIMRNSGPVIDRSLEAVYRQAREAAGLPVSEAESWTLELLVGVDSGLEALDGPELGAGLTQLAEAVGDRTVRRHFASRHSVGGDSVRVLPAWLLDDGRKRPGRSLCVVTGAFAAHIHIADALTTKPLPAQRLRSYALRRRRPSEKRRRRLAAEAQHLLGSLQRVLGAEPHSARILRRIAEHPLEAEREALAVWNGLVDECCNRLGRQAVMAGMTLEGLALLPQYGDRKWFLHHYPWAFAAALASGDAERLLRRIDENPANARSVAERLLCCRRLATCRKARHVARRMPKYRADPGLLRVLGRYGDGRDTRCRAILLEANACDSGELLAHAVRDSARTRRQLDFAARTVRRAGAMGGSPAVHRRCGLLAFRSFAWSRHEPDGADPASVVEGLAAASIDCLAGFAARHWLQDDPGGDDFAGCDPVDCGILALIGLLEGDGRPALTGKQLAAFTEGAAVRSVHRIRILEHVDIGSGWPGPPGWNAGGGIAGARLLATPGAVRTEGRTMQNCLRHTESYIHASSLGRLVLFAIQAPGGARATLSLASVESVHRDRIRLEGYRVSELRGFGNGEPDPACRAIAARISDALNGGCPRILPPEEAFRRAAIRRKLNEHRSYNDDPGAAEQRWRDLYLPLLPRRFAGLPAQDVVEDWIGKRAGTA